MESIVIEEGQRRRRRQEVEEAADEVLDNVIVESLPEVRGFLSTGCSMLDIAISGRIPGGIPLGRITHIYGAEATAKTVVAMGIAGAAQRAGGKVFFGDVEHTLECEWAKLFGLDCSNKETFEVFYPEYLEGFFDINLAGIIKQVKEKWAGKPIVVATDSVTALPAKDELSCSMDEGSFGTIRARRMSLGFRKYIRQLAENNITLICIDQTRDNIGQAFGPKETVSGGRALKFYSSIRLHLTPGKKIKNKNNVSIGTSLGFCVEKNKVFFPYRQGDFDIIWSYGIDDISTSLAFIRDFQANSNLCPKGFVQFEGKNYRFGSLISYIEDNNLEAKLQEEFVKVWNEVHAQDERKGRLWK
jgi:protein RecA